MEHNQTSASFLQTAHINNMEGERQRQGRERKRQGRERQRQERERQRKEREMERESMLLYQLARRFLKTVITPKQL